MENYCSVSLSYAKSWVFIVFFLRFYWLVFMVPLKFKWDIIYLFWMKCYLYSVFVIIQLFYLFLTSPNCNKIIWVAILITSNSLCDFSQNFLIFWWPNFLLSCNHSLILSQQSGLLFYFLYRSCSCCIRCKRVCWCWVGLDQERWLSSWCRYWEYVMCWCHEPRELRIGRVCFCLTLKPCGLLDSWESIRT